VKNSSQKRKDNEGKKLSLLSSFFVFIPGDICTSFIPFSFMPNNWLGKLFFNSDSQLISQSRNRTHRINKGNAAYAQYLLNIQFPPGGRKTWKSALVRRQT